MNVRDEAWARRRDAGERTIATLERTPYEL